MVRKAGFGTSLALVGAVFAGAASSVFAQEQPKEPDLPGLAGTMIKKSKLKKMQERTPDSVAAEARYYTSWACKDGVRNGYVVNTLWVVPFEAAGVVKPEYIALAKDFIFTVKKEDAFFKDNLPYTYEVIQRLDGLVLAQVKENPALAKSIKTQIEAFESAKSTMLPSYNRSAAIVGLVDLACGNEGVLMGILKQAVSDVDFKKVADEIQAARTKFGIVVQEQVEPDSPSVPSSQP